MLYCDAQKCFCDALDCEACELPSPVTRHGHDKGWRRKKKIRYKIRRKKICESTGWPGWGWRWKLAGGEYDAETGRYLGARAHVTAVSRSGAQRFVKHMSSHRCRHVELPAGKGNMYRRFSESKESLL